MYRGRCLRSLARDRHPTPRRSSTRQPSLLPPSSQAFRSPSPRKYQCLVQANEGIEIHRRLRVDEDNNVLLTLLAWFYSSNQKVGNALWYKWRNATLTIKTCELRPTHGSLSADVLLATLRMTLDNDVYSQVRSAIHKRLKDAGKLDLLVPLCKSKHPPHSYQHLF